MSGLVWVWQGNAAYNAAGFSNSPDPASGWANEPLLTYQNNPFDAALVSVADNAASVDWSKFGYAGQVSTVDPESGYVNWSPDWVAWMQAQGIKPAVSLLENGTGDSYAGWVDANGQPLPGTVYLNHIDDQLFWTAALIAMSVVTAGVAASTAGGAGLGASIIGPDTAAQYPGLAAGIDNAASQALVTGGDVKGAVKGAILSYFGGTAGTAVGGATLSATGIDLAGQIADKATKAYISGGNVSNAIQGALIGAGVSQVALFDWPDNSFTDPTVSIPGALPTDLAPIEYTPPAPAPIAVPDVPTVDTSTPAPTGYGSVDLYGGAAAPGAGYSAGSSLFPPSGAAALPPAAQSTDSSSIFSSTPSVQQVTQAALAALSVVKAFKQLNNPAVSTVARTSLSNGSVQTALDDGLIHTRASNGAVSTAKPPVGTPQATANGNIIVNNGDGTYTLISANGTSSVQPYPPSLPTALSTVGASLTANPLLLGGLALAAILLLRK